MFATKLTNAGKPNPAYESIEKVMTEFTSIASGAGEAGAELIVGWNELKKELGNSQGVYEIHVHNYIGGDEIDELVINSNQINDKISGGRG